MVHMMSHLARAIVVTTLAVSAVRAQATQPHRTSVLDLTLGSHNVSGAVFDYRRGGFADLFVAGAVRSTPARALVAGVGVGAIMGGFGDRCLLRPDGSCAPQANFIATSALAGIDVPLGEGSGRLLVGPALYTGNDNRSVGFQARMDLSLPALAHVGLGGMARMSVLKSTTDRTDVNQRYTGEWFRAVAMGVSVFVR